MRKSGKDHRENVIERARETKNERMGEVDYATILMSHRQGGGRAPHLVVMRESSSYPHLLEELQRDISEPQISLLIYLRNGRIMPTVKYVTRWTLRDERKRDNSSWPMHL